MAGEASPGRFLLTFDVELLWGLFFEPRWRKRALREFGEVRGVFREILEILRRRRIRATFAFVGHLFLDACERKDGRVHPDMPRPIHDFFEGDWYRFDPGTDLAADPLWYGRDLVEIVRDAEPGHEIGCHGFSHAFLDSGREVARAEMAAAAGVADEMGIRARSFVYPRNVVAYTDELPKAGFTHYRESGRSGSRAWSLLRRLVGAAPPVGKPRDRGGLVEVPAGIPVLMSLGVRRLVPLRSRLAEIRKGLESAAAESACFHLWTHPHNFLPGRERMLDYLDRALALVEEARDRGDIEVVTMGEVSP